MLIGNNSKLNNITLMTQKCNFLISLFRLPYKLAPNPYFVISLNQVKVAKTKVKSSTEPFNDEQFTIE